MHSDLYAGNSLRFTCEVQIHRSVDTCVNVSLTWIRGYQRQRTENHTTKYIIIDSTNELTPFSVTSKMIINDLSSLDQKVSCKGVVYSLEERYILSSGESSQTITFDVTGRCMTVLQVYVCIIRLHMLLIGVFLRFNNSVFPNSSSVLVSDLQPIQCHSDNSKANGQPQWRFPNGTRVKDKEDGVIVATKQDGHVTLSRVVNSTIIPIGEYCCYAQDARGESHTLCVNVIPGKHGALLHRL